MTKLGGQQYLTRRRFNPPVLSQDTKLALKTASEGIRKAAALQGIYSGKWSPRFDPHNQGDTEVVATVCNRNHPDGIKILQGEAENALCYTWREIKGA